MPSRRTLILGLVMMTASLLIAVMALWSALDRNNRRVVGGLGGPFALVDQTGAPFTERDMLGRPTLIFFGFTHCPDVCPTKLQEATLALNKLGADAARVNMLFVTVDPERDTAAQMQLYLQSFHPTIKGLTGTPEQISAMAKLYRVYYRKVAVEGGYTMDHFAGVYLLDKEGRFVSTFALDREPDAIAADLKKLI